MSFYQILGGVAAGVALAGGIFYSQVSSRSSRKGIPEKMKAVMLVKDVDFNKQAEGTFEVQEIAVPVPKKGEVLVKIERSPINPSDIGNMKGSYDKTIAARTKPYQLGFEGAGTVVQTGGGLMGWLHSGKRVAVCAPAMGIWAEYCVVPALNCIDLPDDVSFEEGCSCFVNPMTVIAFLKISTDKKAKAIVHTAAASQLGKMLIRLAPSYGIELINVVRKPEQKDELLAMGAKHVLLSSDAKFTETLKAKCSELKATLAFDAISGESSKDMFDALPLGGEVFVYGGLSTKPAGPFETGALISTGKSVRGFYLGAWLPKQPLWVKASLLKQVAKHIKNELRSEIAAVYPMTHTRQALMSYVQNMSAGKILIAPPLAEPVIKKAGAATAAAGSGGDRKN